MHKEIEKEKNSTNWKQLPSIPSLKLEQVYNECKECGKNLNSTSMQKHMRDVHEEVEIKEDDLKMK